MDRGIASDESRMALPPFNPPKPFEWYKKRGNGVWDLRVNEEAEAVMQAEEEQKKLERGKLEELEKRAVAAARLAEQKLEENALATHEVEEKVKSKNEKQKQKAEADEEKQQQQQDTDKKNEQKMKQEAEKDTKRLKAEIEDNDTENMQQEASKIQYESH